MLGEMEGRILSTDVMGYIPFPNTVLHTCAVPETKKCQYRFETRLFNLPVVV